MWARMLEALLCFQHLPSSRMDFLSMFFQMGQGWGVVCSRLPSQGLFSTRYFCPATAPVNTAPFRIPSTGMSWVSLPIVKKAFCKQSTARVNEH